MGSEEAEKVSVHYYFSESDYEKKKDHLISNRRNKFKEETFVLWCGLGLYLLV